MAWQHRVGEETNMASRAVLSNLFSIPDEHIQQHRDRSIHTGKTISFLILILSNSNILILKPKTEEHVNFKPALNKLTLASLAEAHLFACPWVDRFFPKIKQLLLSILS